MGQDLFTSMSISAAGLSAQQKRMTTIAKNIANAETTRGEDGGPYVRKDVVFGSTNSAAASPTPPPALPFAITLEQTAPQHLTGIAPGLPEVPPTPTVTAQEVTDPKAQFQLVHDPQHPDAGPDGYVRMPDIDMVAEMVDLAAATRAYEANLAAMKAYQSIFNKSLEI